MSETIEKLKKVKNVKERFEHRDKLSDLNYRKYFVGVFNNKPLCLIFSVFFIVGIFLAFLLIYPGKGLKKEELHWITYFGFGCLVFSYLGFLILALLPRRNFKGVLLDIESDLFPNYHYRLIGISGDICQIELAHPEEPTMQPWTQSWKLKQLTEQFDLEFKPGLVFGKRKDGTFYFVSPDVPKGKSDEKGTSCA